MSKAVTYELVQSVPGPQSHVAFAYLLLRASPGSRILPYSWILSRDQPPPKKSVGCTAVRKSMTSL